MTDSKDFAFCGPTDKGYSSGLTKREYIATQMMLGLLSSVGSHDIDNYEDFARDAVVATDLLIDRLNKNS